MFPRLTHDYGDFAELGLELSCPEAAKLILNAPLAPLMVDTRLMAVHRGMTSKPWLR